MSEIHWIPDTTDSTKYVKESVLSPYSRHTIEMAALASRKHFLGVVLVECVLSYSRLIVI